MSDDKNSRARLGNENVEQTESLQANKKAFSRPEPFEAAVWIIITVNVLAFAFIVAAFCQQGWSGGRGTAGTALGVAFGVSYFLFIVQDGYRWGWTSLASGLVGPAVMVWVVLAGTFASWRNFAWDAAAAIGGLVLGEVIVKWQKRRALARDDDEMERWPGMANNRQTVWAFLGFWLLASLFTVVRTGPLPLAPERFAEVAQKPLLGTGSQLDTTQLDATPLKTPGPSLSHDAETLRSLRVGLALSGGGFRAAVFHAGVLEALEELGLPINNLSTVSGGSIIGAFYAAGGDPSDFVDAVVRGEFDLKRQLLLIHNLPRLLFPARWPGSEVELFKFYRFDRLDVQHDLLQRTLFGKKDSTIRHERAPSIMIAATDLTYGAQVGLLDDGLLRLGDSTAKAAYRGSAFAADTELSLTQRVVISGAFPGAFPARGYEVRIRPDSTSIALRRPLLLVDGGARDNTGLELLKAADQWAETRDTPVDSVDWTTPKDWGLDLLLGSDAGAIFGVQEESGSSLTQALRTVGVSGIPFHRPAWPSDRCEALRANPLKFSPSTHFLSPDSQFTLGSDDPERATLDHTETLRIDPSRYDRLVLELLAGEVPDQEKRSRTLDEIKAFFDRWSTHQTVGRSWSKALKEGRSSCSTKSLVGVDGGEAPLNAATDGRLPGVCEALRVNELLRGSIEKDLTVFSQTPTLQDRLDRKTATALQRLGRTLVYLNWPRLVRQLHTAATCRESSMSTRPR